MTMEDIARISGTARSTVHAVLTNKSWVSESTRKRVLEVVERYNYQPNRLASALGRKSSRLIALILKDIMNPFNSLVVDGINGIIRPAGYNPLLLSTEDDHGQEVRAVSAAQGYRADGFIITPQQIGVDLRHIWNLVTEDQPLVTLGRVPGLETSWVELDEVKAGEMAVDCLADRGHERICLLRGPYTSGAAEGRVTGFRNALMRRGIPVTADLVADCGATVRDGYRVALDLLADAGRRPTALICYNDLVAAGVYRAAAEREIRIPEDLSVIGVDNIELSGVFGPPLTTIAQPCLEMGTTMAEFLLKEIGEPGSREHYRKVFEPVLVERSSVGPASRPAKPTARRPRGTGASGSPAGTSSRG